MAVAGVAAFANALPLKLLAVALILLSSAAGVSIPLAGRRSDMFRGDSLLFALAKAFAAGVILATGFVHILPDAIESLDDPSLSGAVWARFPFAGFAAMLAAIGTLLVDFVGTRFYKGRREKEREIGCEDSKDEKHGKNIVGIHVHAAEKHGMMRGEEDSSHSRHVVAAQILELGIVSHSVIIGLSLGVSEKPSTIRPLIAALSFHQFFEGFALGGCISQAGFQNLKEILMACFFAITTPGGIGIGIATASFYNPESPTAIVVQGILDSISAGILIYMALVDLIAKDFLSCQETSSLSSQIFRKLKLLDTNARINSASFIRSRRRSAHVRSLKTRDQE